MSVSSPAPAPATSRVPWLEFGAGALGGAIGAVVTSPLEVVKTRLQSSAHAQSATAVRAALAANAAHRSFFATQTTTMVECFRDIVRVEGMRAFWKGLVPNLIGVVPARAIYFATYSWIKPRLAELSGGETAKVHFAAATAASLVTSSATNPIWLVKTRLQLERSSQRRSLMAVTKDIFRSEGLRGFYTGLTASYAGVIETAMYWVLYERLKKLAQNDADSMAVQSAKVFLIAAGTKFFACSVCYPHEVLRTRLREAPDANGVRKYTGFLQAGRLIWHEEKARGLYKGLLPHIIRVVPNSAIIFLTFELVVKLAAPAHQPAQLVQASTGSSSSKY